MAEKFVKRSFNLTQSTMEAIKQIGESTGMSDNEVLSTLVGRGLIVEHEILSGREVLSRDPISKANETILANQQLEVQPRKFQNIGVQPPINLQPQNFPKNKFH
jgi:predicted AAA+ superfamily ATPase